MNRTTSLVRGALLAAALLAGGTGLALAQDAASLKAQGVIGEQPDGLLGFVAGTVTPDVRSAVERINAERKSRYEGIARQTGRPLPEVQAVAGEKLMAATPPGQYVRGAGGWARK